MLIPRNVPAVLLCVALLAGPGIPSAVGQVNKKILDDAEQKLRGPGEGVVREGANLCLEQNNVPAVELLLEVLNGDQPHRRDIVWEVLPKITDPYARRRVESELKSSSDGRVRQWCAQALGLFGPRDFAPVLEKALRDKEPFVRAAAAQALGRLRHPAACDKLKALRRDKEATVRCYAIEALVRTDAAAWRAEFGEALRDGDGGARAFVLGVVPEAYPGDVEALSAPALADADWRVRLTAVDNLCGVNTKTGVDLLIPMLGDGRPVVAARAIAYLQRIAGLRYTMKVQWEEWWRVNRESFAFPVGDENANKHVVESTSRASFNGLEVTSDHVAFVIDKSADMNRAGGDGERKDDKARKELTDTLSHLHGGDFVFNVHTYGAAFNTFEDQPVVLDKKSEKKALAFLDGIRCGGSKAIWEVLERVVSDPDIDTVYLLSSGEPEVGLYVHYNRVCDHLAELNRFHRAVIHTVAYTDSKWYQDQLQKIAEATGGKFIARP